MSTAKILFADDNPTVVKLVETFLKVNKYEIHTAMDGQRAYEIANEIHPDIIISDVMMPNMSGFDLCRKLRENALTWHIPVMLLSAKDQIEDKVHGLEEGADDYMTKPFDLNELLARVKGLLKRSREAMDANPSTKLPGNVSIERAIVRRINEGEQFAVCYCDLDNFKAFNDHYGFYLGDRAIKFTGEVIKEIIREHGNPMDFVGHIGGDDFIFITTPNLAEELCQKIIHRFDTGIREFYRDDDLKRGYIITKNRQGITVEFPIMSISIAVITNQTHQIDHPGQISMIEGDLKAYVKSMEGSNFVVDHVAGNHARIQDFEEIVIAHNNRDFTYKFKTEMNGYPFTITMARNGAEAILYAVENEPALMIVDPGLNIISGEHVFNILRSNEKFSMLPILFFANQDNYPFVKEQVSQLGASGIIMEESPITGIAEHFAQILDVRLK